MREKTTARNPPSPRSKADTEKLLYELQVHQIKLEMQGEELLRAKEEAERAKEKYEDLFEFAPAGYFNLDRRGTVLSANLTGARLLGIDRSRLIGQNYQRYLSGYDLPAFEAFLAKIFETGEKQVCEATLLKAADGELFFTHIEAIASRSGAQCRVMLTDITARRRAEEA